MLVRTGHLLGSFKSQASQPAALRPLSGEWTGLSIDFTDNSYAMKTATQAESSLSPSPTTVEDGMSLSFTDNSFAVRI